ncbi:MAG: c-type cytochrome [Alloacidobacterium sp.]
MKAFAAAAAFVFAATAGTASALCAEDAPPPWAWAFATPPPPGTPPAVPAPPAALDNTTQLNLPGSKLSFTRAQIANPFGPADWFPEDHPTMPNIVAHGRESAQPQIWACGYCHYPNGKGRPENASVAGLGSEYIVQQLMDFRSGARKTSDPRKANTAQMAGFATAMTDEEIREAAKYFSSMPATPWIKVAESETAPKTRRPKGMMFLTLAGSEAGSEPLGQRIIETPVSADETEILRNPRSGFVAYVPPGSLEKGRALVENGVTASGGKVTPCTPCHGLDLRGLGPVPGLAGRSPSYIARQLYDIQHGNRAGTWSPLMAAVVANLGPDDLLAASAYLASLGP